MQLRKDQNIIDLAGLHYGSPVPERWQPWWDSFELALLGERHARPRTLLCYHDSLAMFGRFLPEPVPDLIDASLPGQLRDWFAWLNANRKPATVSVRYRALHSLFSWLVTEGEMAQHPMFRIQPPRVPEVPIPVLSREELKRLLGSCRGDSFTDRRDYAMLLFLLDTGTRREGLERMRVGHVDLRAREAVVSDKSNQRVVSLGAKASAAMDRYLRSRAHHPFAQAELDVEVGGWLWLGARGHLTGSGIYQVVEGRLATVGLNPRSAVHVFRHTFSHMAKVAGARDEDLKVLGGWRSSAMVERYGRSAAADRARAAHKRFSPGDQV